LANNLSLYGTVIRSNPQRKGKRQPAKNKNKASSIMRSTVEETKEIGIDTMVTKNERKQLIPTV